MPRFYFDLRHSDGVAVDEEGMEFSGLKAAVEEATRVLAKFFSQDEENLENAYVRGMIIDVRDESGSVTEVSHTTPTRH